MTHANGKKVFVVVFAGGEGAFCGELPPRSCNPPTTPPITAAAMMIAKMRPNSSQKCRRRKPHIRRPLGADVAVFLDGEGGISPIFLGDSGLVGLRPDLTVE